MHIVTTNYYKHLKKNEVRSIHDNLKRALDVQQI